MLKAVVLDENDNKPYHMIFSNSDVDFIDYQKNLLMAISLSLWIDEDTTSKLEKLNELFYNLSIKTAGKSKFEMIEFGKKYYLHVSELRFQLENSTKRGLYNLHDVTKAFRTRKKNTKIEFRELK